MVPADHGTAIGVIEIERGHDLFIEPGLRIVGHPQVVFLEYDIALGQDILVLEDKAGHAVGLEFHHLRQLVAWHALEIAGVVGRCERVLAAADLEYGLGKFAGRMLRRSLEHEVFEEVGKSRFARRLVGGPDLVPDHLGHHRRAVILNHQDLQAVGKRERGRGGGRERGLGVGAGRREGERNEKRGRETVCGHHDLSEGANVCVRVANRHPIYPQLRVSRHEAERRN